MKRFCALRVTSLAAQAARRRIVCTSIALALLFAACAPPPAPAPTPNPQLDAAWSAWRTSAHADTYDLGKGPNTYCARCHSPRNWDPAAVIDAPPNCVSCKFEFESAPRVAAGNPLVAPGDWRSIGCDVCHPGQGTAVSADLAWLNAATGAHAPVASPTALCEKCHVDTDTLRHRRDLGGGAHGDYECTGCHDAHATTADCTAAGCHEDAARQFIATTPAVLADVTATAPESHPGAARPAGHDPVHAAVSCVACHDAGGLEVGPLEAGGAWVTWRTTELLGRSNTAPYQSHYLQRTVDCARCHFAGNTWGLAAPVEAVTP